MAIFLERSIKKDSFEALKEIDICIEKHWKKFSRALTFRVFMPFQRSKASLWVIEWSEQKKFKSKGSPSTSTKNLWSFLLIMEAPQITLLHLIKYLCYCLYWISVYLRFFFFKLVNSISTLRKIDTQQIVEDGLLWSKK